MYFVFRMDLYYPRGGLEDCTLKTNNLQRATEANAVWKATGPDTGVGTWGYILNGQTGEVLERWEWRE